MTFFFYNIGLVDKFGDGAAESDVAVSPPPPLVLFSCDDFDADADSVGA